MAALSVQYLGEGIKREIPSSWNLFLPSSLRRELHATPPAITTDPVVFEEVTSESAGCPNGNWAGSVDLSNVTYTGHYSFQQPDGSEISALSFDFQ